MQLIEIHVTGQLIPIASDLAPQLDKCADRICIGKDAINHAFLDFITFWGRTTTMSTYQDLSIPGIVILPWWIVLGVLNYEFNVPFLPQPKLYLFQVNAEMRYQKQLLIDSSIAALAGIEESCRFPDPAQRMQVFEALMDKITNYQEKVKRNLKESCPIWHNLFHYKTETCVTLEKFDTLGKSVRYRVHTIQDIIEIYKDYYRSLRTHFQQIEEIIHNSPPSESSYKGYLTSPQLLESYIQGTPFLIHQQHLGANGSSVTPHLYVGSYDINFHHSTLLPVLRSAVAQLCKDSKNFTIVSGALYMICAIQALESKVSDLNIDNVSGVQRSWFEQRQQVLSRYNKTKGLDEESILHNFVNEYRAYKNGTSVPERI